VQSGMETLILISNQTTLYQVIAALLPDHWILLHGDQFDQVQRYLEESEQPSGGRLTILIDINNQPEWARQITNVKWNNVLLLGLVDDPDEQESAIRMGMNDYLLKPWLASEIKYRLIRRLQEQKIIQGLINLNNQKERQASVGRLTSYICHDINNAMQAAGGALELALEESETPNEVVSYLIICRQETRRVAKLIDRMRQIYRPQGREQEPIQLNSLLEDVLTMASEEMKMHDVIADGEIAAGLPAIRGVPDQLYLAFLSILLNLCDAIGSAGGILRYRCDNQKQFNQVEFCAVETALSPDGIPEKPDISFTMEPARTMIIANNGEILTGIENRELFIRVRFPIITG